MAKTVLMVEDNEDIRFVCVPFLKHFGYDVLEAANAEEGIRAAREQRPSLILMDIALPGMHGWQAIESLKSDYRTVFIPIVVFTAYDTRATRDRAAAFGCTYIAKPCDPFHLAEEVQRLIGPAIEGQPADGSGPIRVDGGDP